MNETGDRVTMAVYSALLEVGVPESWISGDAKLLDLMLDEDATCWFVPLVEKALGIRAPDSEWEKVVSVADTVRMLRRHVS